MVFAFTNPLIPFQGDLQSPPVNALFNELLGFLNTISGPDDLVFPADGTINQALTTDGAGTLSFQNIFRSNVDLLNDGGTGANNQVLRSDGDGTIGWDNVIRSSADVLNDEGAGLLNQFLRSDGDNTAGWSYVFRSTVDLLNDAGVGGAGQFLRSDGDGTTSWGAVATLGAWTEETISPVAVVTGDRKIIKNAGAFTVTLPLTPSVGDEVSLAPGDGVDWVTNNITLGRNGELIEGVAADGTLDVSREVLLLFVGGTTGWSIVELENGAMIGATAGVDGKEGSVPKPTAGQDDEVLFGDGTFKAIEETTFVAITWITKDANYTAVAGEAILADTDTIGSFTLTFPASPSVGDQIRVRDKKGTFNVAKLTIDPNGNNIENQSANLDLTIKNAGFRYYYVGAAEGWLAV